MGREPSPEYCTQDLSLAAFLLTLGHPLLRLDGDSRRKRMFVFPAVAAGDARRFFQHEKVSAWSYSNALKALKAQLYSA